MTRRILSCLSVIGALIISYSFISKNEVASERPNRQLIYDSIPANYYISEDFFGPYSLKSSKKTNHMHVWNNPDTKGMYRTVNDIRYRFENADRAAADFDKNLEVYSEGGREIHPAIKISGSTHLHIYTESKKMESLLKGFGLSDTRFYYFLFLMDNVYVKVYLSVDKSISVKQASLFAIEAARSVQNATGNKTVDK
jgi:hypothetical protein